MGGVYSPKSRATGFIGVVVSTGGFGPGIVVCVTVLRNILFPSPTELAGSDGVMVGGDMGGVGDIGAMSVVRVDVTGMGAGSVDCTSGKGWPK